MNRFAAKEVEGHDVAEPEAYLLHRILHGVPEGSTDIPPTQSFPMDSNMDVMGGREFLSRNRASLSC